jgi:hypothetical protein
MIKRRSKIAKLPKDIQFQVNTMIDEGATYPSIVDWLAAKGYPDITVDTLYQWKEGGFQDWLAQQQQTERARALFQWEAEFLLQHPEITLTPPPSFSEPVNSRHSWTKSMSFRLRARFLSIPRITPAVSTPWPASPASPSTCNSTRTACNSKLKSTATSLNSGPKLKKPKTNHPIPKSQSARNRSTRSRRNSTYSETHLP